MAESLIAGAVRARDRHTFKSGIVPESLTTHSNFIFCNTDWEETLKGKWIYGLFILLERFGGGLFG
jgi:hypothetical protein